MKYSLVNKEFKKRNNIFGERKHQEVEQEVDQTPLDCINQLGEDLEDSKVQESNASYYKRDSIYQFIDFTGTKQEETRQKNRKSFLKNTEIKAGKHGLSPNIKPSIQIVRIAPPITTISAKPRQIGRKILSLQSNVFQYHHYSQDTQIQLAEMKQIMNNLYRILMKNNERVVQLQNILYLLINGKNKAIVQMHYCLSNVLKLDNKVDLFLNTMRNVYQSLRISKLKQENLELYIKQVVPSRLPQSQTKNNAIISSKAKETNSHMQSFKETQELMSLLEYQSESSLVQPYFVLQKEQKSKKLLKSADKFSFQEENQSHLHVNYKAQSSIKEKQVSNTKQTFRIDHGKFQRLSPFQANRLISNSDEIESFFYQIPKIDEEAKVSHIKQSPKSNWSYSFETNQFDKFKAWCLKRGEQKMQCWLDDMGCLRRPNMTYVFWPNGEVMRLAPKTFSQLENQRLIMNCKRQ